MAGLWHEGENRAADAVVVVRRGRGHSVLLVERADGSLALPGGFVDGNRPGVQAARRTAVCEAREETGLELGGGCLEVGYFARRDRDPRATPERWVSSRAFLFDLGSPRELPRVAGGDDARAALWMSASRALARRLYADHREILRRALALLG